MNSKSATAFILFLLVLQQTMFQWIVTSLPLPQRKTPDNDIIAGKDFLSLFMTEASYEASSTTASSILSVKTNQPRPHKLYTRRPTAFIPKISTLSTDSSTSTKYDLNIDSSEQHESIVRNLRSSRLYSYNIHYNSDLSTSTYSSENPIEPEFVQFTTPINHDLEDMKVISVRVSSSIGTSQNAGLKNLSKANETFENSGTFSSNDNHLNFVSKNNTSSFIMSETTTINSAPHDDDEILASSSVKNHITLPKLVRSGANEDYLIQKHIRDSLPQEQRYHHSVTFHDQGRNGTKARSVSFSSVIQSLSPVSDKNWEQAETIERPTYSPNSHNLNLKKSFYNYGLKYPHRINEETATYISKEIYSDIIDKKNLLNSDIQVNKEKPYEENGFSNSDFNKVEETTELYAVPNIYGTPEKNYEVDETVSVMSNGRAHGVQETPANDNQKVGYVVEGRNFRKYRVEERTSDGFIVGEYGVVSHDDGSLRGVRYTADGTINPRLIYDALMKFLSL